MNESVYDRITEKLNNNNPNIKNPISPNPNRRMSEKPNHKWSKRSNYSTLDGYMVVK